MPNRIGKAPCIRICHSFSEPGGFKNPQTSAHSPGTPPGVHNGVGPGGMGKLVLAKASSMMLMGRGSLPDWRRHAAPWKSPATVSTCCCNTTVRTVTGRFIPMPRFFAKWLLMVERPYGGVRLAIARCPPEQSTGDDGL